MQTDCIEGSSSYLLFRPSSVIVAEKFNDLFKQAQTVMKRGQSAKIVNGENSISHARKEVAFLH